MASHSLPLHSPGPASSYSHSNFHLPSPSSSSPDPDTDHNNHNDDSMDDEDDDGPLPFPEALSRRDFLAPDFDAASYLSSLHTGGPASRHQTLEDLRGELRDRSAAISAELLELVNAHYADFLGLGDQLQGGEDRVEDVRVALLGFRRAVDEVRARVRERRAEAGALNRELRDVKGAVELGRKMLELDERVAGLEARLAVGSTGMRQQRRKVDGVGDEDGWDDDVEESEGDEEEDEDEGEEVDDEGGLEFISSSPSKLAALARDYVAVENIAGSIGRDMPFVKKMEERMSRYRSTILLDLGTALKEARKAGLKGQGRVLKLLGIYRVLDAQSEAVKVLKEK